MGSALGFVGGWVMSCGALERISGPRLGQLSRQLAKRGTVAVAVLRLVPIATFAVFNLAAGASHLGFRQFMGGSLLGLTLAWARSRSSRTPSGRRSVSRPGKTWPLPRRGARAVGQTLAALRLKERDAAMCVAT
jgi:hypothetical protein